MRALVIDNHSIHINHSDEVEQLLRNLGCAEFSMVTREEISDTNTETYDLLFLSGTSGVGAFRVMGNEDKLVQEFNLVLHCEKPLIGVCYGCQILARAYGGELEPLANPIDQQVIHITTTQVGADMLGEIHPREYSVYSSRKNLLTRVPDEFLVLAESGYGPEIVVHKTRPFVGVMFHPEHILLENHGAKLVQKIFNTVLNR